MKTQIEITIEKFQAPTTVQTTIGTLPTADIAPETLAKLCHNLSVDIFAHAKLSMPLDVREGAPKFDRKLARDILDGINAGDVWPAHIVNQLLELAK